jgi:hypothetical protein
VSTAPPLCPPVSAVALSAVSFSTGRLTQLVVSSRRSPELGAAVLLVGQPHRRLPLAVGGDAAFVSHVSHAPFAVEPCRLAMVLRRHATGVRGRAPCRRLSAPGLHASRPRAAMQPAHEAVGRSGYCAAGCAVAVR